MSDAVVSKLQQFIKANTGKHPCACGCGGFIVPKKQHSWAGFPAMLRGHCNRQDLAARFVGFTDKSGPGGCWLWTGAFKRGGYGQLMIANRMVSAHRAAWGLANGPIPPGMHVLHRCDNPPCVNPAHLFLGTNADNSKDKIAKGRQRGPKGEAHPAAKLSDGDVVEIRRRWAAGETQAVIGRDFGATQAHVSQIVTMKTWRHLPPPLPGDG